MAVTPLTLYVGQVPQIGQVQSTFDLNNSNMFAYFGTFGADFNARIGEINSTATQINADATTASDSATLAETHATNAEASATIALNASNYKGDWVAGYNTTGYSQGMSVTYSDGFKYVSKIDNNLIEPTTKTNTTEWDYLEAVSDADLALKADKANPTFTGLIKEEVSVSTLTLGATSSVQTYTATADFTIVDDLLDGESVTFILTNAGFTPTYPTITWWEGAEPTLGTTDKLFFEKIGSTLWGSQVASLA